MQQQQQMRGPAGSYSAPPQQMMQQQPQQQQQQQQPPQQQQGPPHPVHHQSRESSSVNSNGAGSNGPKPNIIYPWTHRPLNLLPPEMAPADVSNHASLEVTEPFPRYGHSVSPLANVSSGDMYIFGGLVNDKPSSDLFLLSCSSHHVPKDAPHASSSVPNGSHDIQWVEAIGDVPSPRLGHASVGLGNVLIVWGGDTNTNAALEEMDQPAEPNDDALYLLNLGKSDPVDLTEKIVLR